MNEQITESGALEDMLTSRKVDASKLDPEPRFFWISRLINDLGKELKSISAEDIRRHLPQASDA